MQELGVQDTPVLTVLNKCDRIARVPLPVNDLTALISAKTGFGFDELLRKTAKALAPTHKRLKLLIPYDKTGLINEILRDGKVFSQEYAEDGTVLDALVDVKILHKVAQYAR